MKKAFILTLLLVSILLSACQASISEAAMETAVSQVILTSVANDAVAESDSETVSEADTASMEELDAAKSQLSEAQSKLTEQAAGMEELQAELDQVYLLLTPTITPTPMDTPTQLPTLTATPRPAPTQSGLPSTQKYVRVIDKAPLFYFKDENDSGYPIMIKTSPIQKFDAGEIFIVETGRYRADGGGLFYKVVGPRNAGYFVRSIDVEDYNK